MSKLKSPLISLGAKGTIGDTLTFQKRAHDTIVREKPIPRDPYSLNQAYQRWDYRDYAYLWTLLSNSEKQVYRTKASRYHITGFSQYMRESLKDLPLMVGRWRLDEKAGATAYDSSKQGNHGTIIGASPADGLIAGAQSFDGLNDRIDCGSAVYLSFPYSLEFFFYPRLLGVTQSIIALSNIANAPVLSLLNTNVLYFWFGAGRKRSSAKVFTAGDLLKWWHIVLNVASQDVTNDVHIFIDAAVSDGAVTNVGAYGEPDGHLTIASRVTPSTYGKCRIDNLVARNRILDQTEITRLSQRSYLPLVGPSAPPPTPIDIGEDCIDRTSSWGFYGATWISMGNPANADGTITEVEIWANTNLTNCKVGIFELVSGITYKCTAVAIIGAVTAGSKQTFPVSLAVNAGDFIGIHADTGRMERDDIGFGGKRYIAGDHCIVDDEAIYLILAGDAISLHGTG